ncbi:cytochrome P450 2U1-like [Amphiura filiformis]|uniref:cytochrome P450 2U1-like n=1 Tax=Amphiura filiformis TaxID=82378 RepID=UPI003B21CD42
MYIIIAIGIYHQDWPLVGYLPNLVISAYRTGLPPAQLLDSLAKKYGQVFSINIAGKLVVVLNNFQYVKEGYNNPSLEDRLVPRLKKDLGDGGRFASHSWKEQKRIILTTLRGLGVGKRSFEANISEEAAFLADEIRSCKVLEVTHFFNNATANVICSVVLGKRFEYSDLSFKRLTDTFTQNAKNFALAQFFPFVKYLQLSRYNAMAKNVKCTMDFAEDFVNGHKKVHVENEPNDFIDVYLDEIKQRQKSNLDSFVNEKNLIAIVRDIFAAGTETTSSTLRWAVLYMIVFPQIQDRIRQELDSVVGRNRLPKLTDEKELPFTCATLLEVQRIASITPFSGLHLCGQDTALGPYAIPKGTIIVPNLWAIHHHPDLWPEPDEFNPERFLDEDGVLQEKEELIPFSIEHDFMVREMTRNMPHLVDPDEKYLIP